MAAYDPIPVNGPISFEDMGYARGLSSFAYDEYQNFKLNLSMWYAYKPGPNTKDPDNLDDYYTADAAYLPETNVDSLGTIILSAAVGIDSVNFLEEENWENILDTTGVAGVYRLRGDINDDGQISASDAIAMLRQITGQDPLNTWARRWVANHPNSHIFTGYITNTVSNAPGPAVSLNQLRGLSKPAPNSGVFLLPTFTRSGQNSTSYELITGDTTSDSGLYLAYTQSNRVGRFYFVHTAYTTYTADMQIDNVRYNGVLLDETKFQYETTISGSVAPNQSNSAELTVDWMIELLAGRNSWYDIPIGTNTGRWNRDAGGTPSGSTGLGVDANGSSSGIYLYSETSSYFNRALIMRSPVVTLANGASLEFACARYGAAMGTLKVFWMSDTKSTWGGLPSYLVDSAESNAKRPLNTEILNLGNSDGFHPAIAVEWDQTTGEASKVLIYKAEMPNATISAVDGAMTLGNDYHLSLKKGVEGCFRGSLSGNVRSWTFDVTPGSTSGYFKRGNSAQLAQNFSYTPFATGGTAITPSNGEGISRAWPDVDSTGFNIEVNVPTQVGVGAWAAQMRSNNGKKHVLTKYNTGLDYIVYVAISVNGSIYTTKLNTSQVTLPADGTWVPININIENLTTTPTVYTIGVNATAVVGESGSAAPHSVILSPFGVSRYRGYSNWDTSWGSYGKAMYPLGPTNELIISEQQVLPQYYPVVLSQTSATFIERVSGFTIDQGAACVAGIGSNQYLYALNGSSSTSQTIYRWPLQNDVVSGAYVATLDNWDGSNSYARAIHVSADGTFMYVGGSGGYIQWWEMSVPYDLSTASSRGSLATANLIGVTENHESIHFTSDGLHFVTATYSSGNVRLFDLSIAWDVTTATYNSTIVKGTSTNTGVYISDDLSQLGVAVTAQGKWDFYSVSTPGNLATTSSSAAFSMTVNSSDTNVRSSKIGMNYGDGTALVITTESGSLITSRVNTL